MSEDEDISNDVKSVISDTAKEIVEHSKQAIAVLQFKGIYIFIDDIYMDEGKVGFDYSTFPVVQLDAIDEIEKYIREQVCI